MTSTSWWNKTSLLFTLSFKQWNRHPFTTKVPLWVLWDPAPYVKGPRMSFTTWASGNSQIDFILSCWKRGVSKSTQSTLGMVRKKHLENADLGRDPGMREFAETPPCEGEILVCHWRKKERKKKTSQIWI